MNFKYIFISLLSFFILDIPTFSKAQYKSFSKNNLQNIKLSYSKNNHQIINILDNDFKDIYINLGIFFAQNETEDQDFALDIESDIQYQNGNIFVAEGNVIIEFSDGKISADKLKYDTLNKNFEKCIIKK